MGYSRLSGNNKCTSWPQYKVENSSEYIYNLILGRKVQPKPYSDKEDNFKPSKRQSEASFLFNVAVSFP